MAVTVEDAPSDTASDTPPTSIDNLSLSDTTAPSTDPPSPPTDNGTAMPDLRGSIGGSSFYMPTSPTSDANSTPIENVSNGAHGNGAANGASTSYKHKNEPMGRKRPLRVITIGAGAAGITMAFHIKKYLVDVTHVAYEKNEGVGGTWFENRYPGCQCDVPSHAYQFSYAPNPCWSAYYAPQAEILAYMDDTCRRHGLYEHIKLRHEVVGAAWDDAVNKWRVTVRNPEGEVFEDQCDMLVNGSGVLSKWKWPDIPGLSKFKGHLVHSAAWKDYDFTGKRVALIGVGSTATQLTPQLQSRAAHLTCFIRSPSWILPAGFSEKHAGPGGTNFRYSPEDIAAFAADPARERAYAKAVDAEINAKFGTIETAGAMQKGARAALAQSMKDALGDRPDLHAALIPDFAVGCRRLTPNNGFLEALTRPNVAVVPGPIDRITEAGLATAAGAHAVDAIVCATGFDVSLVPRFALTGAGGLSINAKWAKAAPEAYLSLLVEGLPNYVHIMGPGAPIAHGSIISVIERCALYVTKLLAKMQGEPVASFRVKPAAVRDFNAHRASVIKDWAWSAPCSSVFNNGKTGGPVLMNHPGSRLHFFDAIKEPRWEDFDVEYAGNRFAYLGNGFTEKELRGEDLGWYIDDGAKRPDLSYY